MKKLLTIIILILLASISFGQAFPFDMIAHDGGTGSDYAYDVWVDDAGNKYVTGKYKATIDFGSGVTITPINNYDIYLAKYNANNEIQWAKSFGGYSADEGNAITTDADGNVIVTGVFFQSMYIGTDTLFSAGTFDIFVVKFDSDGNYLWMTHGYTENYDKPTDIKVDNQGNYVLLGYYDVNDSLTLPFKYEGLELTTSKGERDVFVIKMDSDGNPLWGVTGGGADNDISGGVVIDRDDNIYFNGYYNDEEATFGSTILPIMDGDEIFTAKLNSSGAYQWAVAAIGPSNDRAYAIEYVDKGDSVLGVVLLTGYFEDSLYVGPENVLFESAGDDDIFVLAYTSDGVYDGGLRFGGEEDEQGKAINSIIGDGGGYYVSGTIESDMIVANDTITIYGGTDMLIMHMYQEDLIWAKNYGGSSTDKITSAAINNDGIISFAGYFKSNPAEFGRFTVSPAGYDLWVGQLHKPTPLGAPVISSISDIPNDQGGKVRIEFTGSELASSFSIYQQIDTTDKWDVVVSFNSLYKDEYSYVAKTLGDSTINGIHWSTFKVYAHTSDVLINYISDPVSGYSIDNLAPVVPGGIIAIGHEDRVEIAWDDNEDKDFQYYAIYRSLDSEFDPDTMSTYTYSTIESSFDDTSVEFGTTYYYRIVAVDYSGNKSEYSENIYALVTDVNSELEIPTVYDLGQNYPNPFNPSTVINFSLPESGLVSLKVFDILGQEVAELVNQVKTAGVYEVSFDASNLTTGLYIYRINAGNFSATKKMLLVK